MITILTVFKSGDLYTDVCVKKLQNSVTRNLIIPHKHVTLSDIQLSNCETILFDSRGHDPQAYWYKMQLYRDLPQLSGPCLYFDLDLVITGELNTLVENLLNMDEKKDIWGAHNPFVHYTASTDKHFFNSSILFWKKNPTHLWQKFITNTPKFWKMNTKDAYTHGDQAFVSSFTKVGFVNNYCPDRYISTIQNFIENKTSILFFAGKKKPHFMLDHSVIQKYWRTE